MPHRILYVITDLDFGGTERQLEYLISGLDSSRFESAVVSLKPQGRAARKIANAGIEVYAPDSNGWLAGRRVLNEAAQRLAPDLIHTFLFRANILGRWAAESLRQTPRVVSSVRVWDGRVLALALERWTLRRADVVVFNSRWVALEFQKATGLPKEKTRLILNAVSPEPYIKAAGRREQTRQKLGIENNSSLILNLGRLDPQKGHEYLIEAFLSLRGQIPKAVLLIAGDGPLRKKLEKKILTMGMRETVRLLGFRPDNTDLLAACDAFALPSLWEGSPNVVLEAWAAGAPVAAASVCGVPELVENEKSGLLVPAANPEALAHALARLITDSTLRQAVVREGKSRLARHSVEGFIAANQNLYASLLENTKSIYT